jgi:hypothetical protein
VTRFSISTFVVLTSLVLASTLFSYSAQSAEGEIAGQITLAKGVTLKPGGALFVMAKEPGKPMPVAVVRIVEPKFPYKFSLTAKNAMVAGTKFTGSYLVTARYSPTGDAMDKSGPEGHEGTDANPVAVGRSDLKIEMKHK